MEPTRRNFLVVAATTPFTLGLGADEPVKKIEQKFQAYDYSSNWAEALNSNGGPAMLVHQQGMLRIVYEPTAGQDFWSRAREAIRLAAEYQASTFYSFNGCPLLAHPQSVIDGLYWDYQNWRTPMAAACAHREV